ncbi:unnamed protein product [Sphagnum jensenii]
MLVLPEWQQIRQSLKRLLGEPPQSAFRWALPRRGTRLTSVSVSGGKRGRIGALEKESIVALVAANLCAVLLRPEVVQVSLTSVVLERNARVRRRIVTVFHRRRRLAAGRSAAAESRLKAETGLRLQRVTLRADRRRWNDRKLRKRRKRLRHRWLEERRLNRGH